MKEFNNSNLEIATEIKKQIKFLTRCGETWATAERQIFAKHSAEDIEVFKNHMKACAKFIGTHHPESNVYRRYV